MSLMELMCTLQPVRNTPSPEARKTSSDKLSRSISTTQPDLSIPKEIWRLVDALYRDGMQTADLFIAEGDNHQHKFLNNHCKVALRPQNNTPQPWPLTNNNTMRGINNNKHISSTAKSASASYKKRVDPTLAHFIVSRGE
eukprot:gene2354-3097_t